KLKDKAWRKKEKREQKIVSDFILDAFKFFTSKKPEIIGPKTIQAGELSHLRTVFFYKGLKHELWEQAVETLHPTPAVAGVPKLQAIDFIMKHEKQNREFYSGYLGP